MSLGRLQHMHKVNTEDEQTRSECAGLIRLAVSWDHKQTVAIMVMNIWVSQNSGKVPHQMSNYQLVKATSVFSFNHSSNFSSCVSTPVWQNILK
jgi:glutamine amidotransferase PdxT